MSKFNSFLETKVMPVAGRLAAQRHLGALRDGNYPSHAADYYWLSFLNHC